MIRFLLLGVVAAFVLAVGAARAEPLFQADFQDGKTDAWLAGGKGDVRLTRYADNVSLRLMGGGVAMTIVRLRNVRQATVSAAFAAQDLGKADACVADASIDGGKTWTPVLAVRDGQDDGVTLHAGSVTLPVGIDDDTLLVRVRAVGGRRATCWADNIRVAGGVVGVDELNVLTRKQLMGGHIVAPIRDLAAFTPPSNAGPPTDRFEGRLIFDAGRGVMRGRRLKGRPGPVSAPRYPAFDFALVQDGADLIPVQRGPVASSHSDWEWVVEPGRVWTQPGDGGFTRAAIPIALQERNANCLHNGVLSFLFKADGTVSQVVWTITGETCAYDKFDAFGLSEARLVLAPVADAAGVIARHRAEVAARLPVRPLADLEKAYPGFDAAALRLAPPAVGDPPTAYGMLVDGVNYAAPCETRHGVYPFCDVLALPSYSTAKSIVAAVALMRLETQHPGVSAETIAAHVPACDTPAWKGVTFRHALDMATGIYGSTAFEADENAPSIAAFFDADGHAAKAAYACRTYGRKEPPGTTFVYHTTDTYLLGAGLAAYVRRHGGGDLYDSVIMPLWTNLGLSPTIAVTRRTYDDVRQPFTGWGLTYHRDDILRIAAWLRDGALLDGKPALDPAMLNAALQRDPAARGLQAGGPNYRYQHGFWARNIAPLIGCATPVWTPFMSGFGGISVVLMPNGTVFYFYGDSEVFDWGAAAIQADRIRRMCP